MTTHADVHQSHPGAALYVRIAVILAVLTGLEVLTFYLKLDSALVVWILLLLGVGKFFLVVGFFMHLKMDDKRFALLFFFPMIVMISLAVALMAIFHSLVR